MVQFNNVPFPDGTVMEFLDLDVFLIFFFLGVEM